LSIAHQPANAPDPQAVAYRGTVDFLHMHQAPVAQDYPVGRDKVGLLKQQQVHGWVAGGWSSSAGWSSG